jgi:hypothetical protein
LHDLIVLTTPELEIHALLLGFTLVVSKVSVMFGCVCRPIHNPGEQDLVMFGDFIFSIRFCLLPLVVHAPFPHMLEFLGSARVYNWLGLPDLPPVPSLLFFICFHVSHCCTSLC